MRAGRGTGQMSSQRSTASQEDGGENRHPQIFSQAAQRASDLPTGHLPIC